MKIKHEIEFNNYKNFVINCYFCGKRGHVAKFCKKVHYVVDDVLKLVESQREELNTMARRKRKKRSKQNSRY